MAIRKLSDKRCSVGEFHFLFNIIKVALGVGTNTPSESPLVSYHRFVERTHPRLFDNFHADLTYDMPVSKKVHPWRLRNRMIADKLKLKVRNRAGRSFETKYLYKE